MAKNAPFTFKGLEEYELFLSKLGEAAKPMIGAALYRGGEIMADALKKSVRALPTISPKLHGSPEKKIDGLTTEQKKGLIDGFGISKMRKDNGVYNIKLGFDGYNGVKTKKYPKGQPNALIARSVESGTSFRKPHPFVQPVVRQVRQACEDGMAKVLLAEIENFVKKQED